MAKPNGTSVAEKPPMLTNKPAPAKPEPRKLSIEESLKVEIAQLQQQLTNLKDNNLKLREQLLQAEKAILANQSDALREHHTELMKSLNLEGNVSLNRNPDGRYTVNMTGDSPK